MRWSFKTMVDLVAIIEPAVTRRVWRKLVKATQEPHLTRAPIARDSTLGLAFQIGLVENLEHLRARVLDGTYQPRPPLILSGAKSPLLTRQLFFLLPEDEVLLTALVSAAHPSLTAGSPLWVSFGRT